jgi:hypothetical protein
MRAEYFKGGGANRFFDVINGEFQFGHVGLIEHTHFESVIVHALIL